MSRPGRSGREPTFQARATSARAEASATGRPPGSRFGSAPASMAPRSPARRGIQARRAPGGEPLAHQDDRALLPDGLDDLGVFHVQGVEDAALVARGGRDQRPLDLGQPEGDVGGQGVGLQPPLAHALAQTQEHQRRLVLRVEAGHQDRRRLLQGRVVHVHRGSGDTGGQEGGLLLGVLAGAGVHVVGVQGDAGELGVGVGVLVAEAAPHQHTDVAARGGQPLRGHADRLGPGGELQGPGVLVTDQRPGEPVGLRGVGERPAALVAVPLLVHLRVVAGEPAGDLAAAVVGALGAAARAVFTDARRGDQVEGARPEPVGGTGERADRADLDGVAGEVGVERLPLGDTDLLLSAALHQFDERVARDLRGEAGAAGALDAAFAVQQHLAGERDGLGEGALDVDEPALALSGGHGLVLEGALAALVADRAVQRVVDEQELHDPALGLLRHLGGQVGVDHHALHDGDRAGGLGLGHAAPVAHVGDLDQALTAGADRVEQRVVAEPGDLDTEQFGGADQQGALGHLDLEAVDGDGDQVLRRRGGGGPRRRCWR
ncbi:hypothetical protein B005_2616 [Nocardiopsis alba ATCC BAA-2165]|uniref:Uncharacterized protein n=1 Tax=Nocardiopsis alba (strain ATCC BAA-2165 / BE74) TaxID=1205910 RepID=J7LFW0_NOCAA|nr:hypothetical protein B005_2616 [Nocardiopsis alba ATCC BAA-2165]